MRSPAVLVLLCLLSWASAALAESDRAAALRRQAGLVPFAPSQHFLDGFFIADEMHPAFLFGPVKAFVAGRTCPTAWLIEDGEQERLSRRPAENPGFEYTLTLEEDCPQGVAWYVFVDQSAMTPRQWIDWRRQFHKRKAESEYADAVRRLEAAVAAGYPVTGELRFVSKDGELDPRSPQELLPTVLHCPPRYDCGAGAPAGKEAARP